MKKVLLLLASLLLLSSCLLPTVKPIVTLVPLSSTTTVGISVWFAPGVPATTATGSLTPWDGTGTITGINNNGRFTFVTASTGGSTLEFDAPGFAEYRMSFTIAPDGPDVLMVLAFPPVPTRAQVINPRLTFQGLTVTTQQLGTLTWFEPFLQALTNPLDRQAVYAAKHAQGDTHLIIEYEPAGPIYNEAPYQNILSPDFDGADQNGFLGLVEEIIQNGFTPIITYNGDDGDAPADGYPNALRQLPLLANLLKTSTYGDLNPYVLYFRGWDSVFYGSTPANIQAFGAAFRSVLPSGYLAIEFNTGHIPVGNGPGDYDPSNGAMKDYDTIMGEFDSWPTVGDAEWQILGRMLGPTFVRPSDMPTGDDPNPPFYLGAGSPRGPYAFACFEWGAYPWTHGQDTFSQIQAGAAYFTSMGCLASFGPKP